MVSTTRSTSPFCSSGIPLRLGDDPVSDVAGFAEQGQTDRLGHVDVETFDAVLLVVVPRREVLGVLVDADDDAASCDDLGHRRPGGIRPGAGSGSSGRRLSRARHEASSADAG
ncbi:hypothetical protein ACU686_13700 [Yinghuangia aomiensis]